MQRDASQDIPAHLIERVIERPCRRIEVFQVPLHEGLAA